MSDLVESVKEAVKGCFGRHINDHEARAAIATVLDDLEPHMNELGFREIVRIRRDLGLDKDKAA